MQLTYTVTTTPPSATSWVDRRYVGLVDGQGSTREAARRDAAQRADEKYGHSCPGGLELEDETETTVGGAS